MIKLCCKVVPINNFQRQSSSSKCFEGNREQCSKFYPFHDDLSASLAMALCSNFRNWCIDLHRLCNTPLESLFNGLIGGKFTSSRGAMSTRRTRTTAIAGPLVVIWYRPKEFDDRVSELWVMYYSTSTWRHRRLNCGRRPTVLYQT